MVSRSLLVLVVKVALKLAGLTLRIDKAFNLVGTSELAGYKRSLAHFFRSSLKHVAYVLGLNIHLQGAFVLVEHNLRGIAFCDVCPELIVRHLLACASADRVASHEVDAYEADYHKHVNPAHAEFGHLVVFILLHVVSVNLFV